MEKRTPLYDRHVAAGGKMAPFGGFMMPIQYEGQGIIAEHMAVREAAGLFDVSHMGEFLISGPDALANLQRLFPGNFSLMQPGEIRYSLLLNDAGGIVDDLLIFMRAGDCYMLVVNASNIEKDYEWIRNRIEGDCCLSDRSEEMGAVALQGPNAVKALKSLSPEDLPDQYYTFIETSVLNGITCIISRNGYTGEDGFEIYTDSQDIATIWDALLAANEGMSMGLVKPCGLGARDTLRFEASMPLYGHELTDEITPMEAGLRMFVKLDKTEAFIGKAALLAKGELVRKRAGFVLKGRGIAREGALIYQGDKPVGRVTSGTMCPFLQYAAVMGYVDAQVLDDPADLAVDIRGKRIPIEKVRMPFYQRAKYSD